MTEVTNEPMCEVLKSMQERLGKIENHLDEVKSEMRAVRGHLGATHQDIANIYTILVRHDGRLDRLEPRLELVEPTH